MLVRYEGLIGQHSQEVYEFFKELDEMNWSTLGNVLHQYLRNTLIGTTVNVMSYFDTSGIAQWTFSDNQRFPTSVGNMTFEVAFA